MLKLISLYRGVVQHGSTPASGAGGHGFKSRLFDHIETTALIRCIKAFSLFTFNQCYVIIKALVNVRKVR